MPRFNLCILVDDKIQCLDYVVDEIVQCLSVPVIVENDSNNKFA